MVGIDTNILIRYLTQDDSEQLNKINHFFFSEQKVFLANVVIAETVWTLRRFYKWERKEIVIALEALLEIPHCIFEDRASIAHATWAYQSKGDWADHLIQAQCQQHQCTALATFDQKFAQFYPGFVKLLS